MDWSGDADEMFGAREFVTAAEGGPEALPEVEVGGGFYTGGRFGNAGGAGQVVVEAIGEGVAIHEAEEVNEFLSLADLEEAAFHL